MKWAYEEYIYISKVKLGYCGCKYIYPFIYIAYLA